MWSRLLKSFRGEKHRPRRRQRSGIERFLQKNVTYFRVATWVVGTVMLVWLFPRESTSEYSSWREGMVAPHAVIAPFKFSVRRNDIELEEARSRARDQVPPVIERDGLITREQQERLLRFVLLLSDPDGMEADSLQFPLSRVYEPTLTWLQDSTQHPKLARRLIPRVLRAVYRTGLISVEDHGLIRDLYARRTRRLAPGAKAVQQITRAVDGGPEEIVSLSGLVTDQNARDNLGQVITEEAARARLDLNARALRALHNLIDIAIVPDLSYERETTLRRQADAASKVAIYKRTIFRDEGFIASHAVLTSEDIDELASLRESQRERLRQTYQWSTLGQWGGRIAMVAGLLLIMAIYLREYNRDVWRKPSWMFLCVLLVWLPLVIASYAASNAAIPVYMIPLALTAMLATVLFSGRVGLVLSCVTVILAGAVLGMDYQVVFVGTVASTVAVFSVMNVRNRNQFMRAMLFLPLGTISAIVVIDALQGTSLRAMLNHAWPGAVGGIAVPILSMGLLVVFEKTFNITTSLTLLELSDLNAPLLRQLSISSPGTYTHSIIISNLVEAAATAIGANALLARVGAYYHDIGKMQRALHFTENQMDGPNPHDRLMPQMSALVIISHVKDGVEIAEKVGLPQQIIDFIPQHQGTMLVAYFYHKAKEMYGPENVREETYRYPGPKPQTREAAILMMADAVEAAVRSLRDKTPSRVKGMVHELIKARLDDGQFDECDLTLRDITQIEESFLPVLAGAMHHRIEYPKDHAARQRNANPKPVPPP
jgi:cyclic-di-AMP phosphodiesterase PgpH